MTLTPGRRLGPYEIVAPIGAGGMGEVYRARDTRLDRDVAIKVLPAVFAEDAHLRLRFEREAKLVSQLTHPNICTLYDIGRDDGLEYLVMELISGETLADRIARGPLPLSDTLRIGAEVADALSRAHRAGVIHRDLKPSNIMVTKSGPKLLDFGLAKHEGAGLGAEGSGSLTAQKPITEEGKIVGTFQYMAPEQLEGLPADPRTDIFALGAVLYEMATGKRAFIGSSRTSLIAAIVSSDPPPISESQPLTPPSFEHVVQKCVAKDPDRRWQTAQDVAEELRWIRESSSGRSASAVSARRTFGWIGWVAAALLVAAATTAFFLLRPRERPERIVSSIIPPDGVLVSYAAGSLALSRDGRKLAFVGRMPNGPRMLWVRALDSDNVEALPGTEGATNPFWSPDGAHLAFGARGTVKKVAVDGGTPEVVLEGFRFTSGAWLSNGELLLAKDRMVYRVPPRGEPAPVTRDVRRVVTEISLLPDEKQFLFAAWRSPEPEGIYVSPIDGGTERLLVRGVYHSIASPPGSIVYSRGAELWAQRVNPKTIELVGEPERIAESVQFDADSFSALFAVAKSGALAYVRGEGVGRTVMTWIGRDGTESSAVMPPGQYYAPRLSNDETRLAYDLSDEQTTKGDLWIYDLVRGVATRFTHDPENESVPVWSHDDRFVYYISEKTGAIEIYRRPSNGAGAEEKVVSDSRGSVFPLSISSDGRFLAYNMIIRPNRDVYVLEIATGKRTPLLTSPFSEDEVAFSPDGKWIAYRSNESGREEVYVQSFPTAGGKWIVSREGGEEPRWSSDGREIFFLDPDRNLMSASVRFEPSFDASVPVELFETRVRPTARYSQYNVAHGGSKFLVNRLISEEGARPITLVQNWASD